MFDKDKIIKGLRCETCTEERVFGKPPNDEPDNLYIYTDMTASTRCFCKKHMTFFTKIGGMVDYKTKDAKVGYGAVLISELLSLEEREIR